MTVCGARRWFPPITQWKISLTRYLIAVVFQITFFRYLHIGRNKGVHHVKP